MTKTNNTFGKFIRAMRESIGKSLRGAAADLGIAPPYMSDLENDRRYPPTGELLKKMEAMFCGNNGELKLYFYDLAGMGRADVPPDMAEHLRSNYATRWLVRMLMQVDIMISDTGAEITRCWCIS